MKSTMIRSLVAAVCALGALFASAVPTSIAYQGVLRDANGAVISGDLNKTIEFRLYTAASGDSQALWGRSVAVLLDSTGLFNVALQDDIGSALENVQYTTLAEAIKAARTSSLYIGLWVAGSSGEISPRQQILSVPYASYAQDVDTAAGDFTVGGRATIKNLTVTDSATFSSDVSFSNGVSMNGNLTVSGNLKVSDANSISGPGTIPIGGIIMWSGSKGSVPNGWKLCDGEDGTPDLRGRFILGADSVNNTGATGGASSVTLSTDNLPPHQHEYFGDDMLQGVDGNTTTQVSRQRSGYDATSKLAGDSKVYWSGATGKGKSFDIMPPYYKLAFIMRIK